MKTKLADLQEWGSFALVTYIPEPLGSFLHGLRQKLPGTENPQAHITILPPRPLQSPVENASRTAQSVLNKFRPFSVGLSEVKMFPETNILYLAITRGSEKLHELHNALNSGLLAHRESFDFLPHLTISGVVPAEQLAKIRTEAERVWQENSSQTKIFEVNEVIALWQPPRGSSDDWNRLWRQKLTADGNSARAGSSG